MLTLTQNDFRLDIAPERGGGITRFAIGEIPLFADARADNDTPLGLSSFVLVPFSNRIKNGRFTVGDQAIALPPNMPEAASDHPIHGFGWLENWDVMSRNKNTALLRYRHKADAWPWSFVAQQKLILSNSGLRHELSLTNTSAMPMPAGLGLHPYFPHKHARMTAQFSGFWHTRADGIPTTWERLEKTPDLLAGAIWDTIFTGRIGAIRIDWPTHSIEINPDADLNETVIYTPQGANFFCVEPVSHITDAINRGGMRMLKPGEICTTGVTFTVSLPQ